MKERKPPTQQEKKEKENPCRMPQGAGWWWRTSGKLSGTHLRVVPAENQGTGVALPPAAPCHWVRAPCPQAESVALAGGSLSVKEPGDTGGPSPKTGICCGIQSTTASPRRV